MTTRETVALALNRLRKEKGYSVDDLGKIVGRSAKTISAWEVGRGQPDADMLVHLCSVYGLAGVGVFFGEPTALAGTISEDELVILKQYRTLNENGKRKTIEYISDIAKNLDNIS